VAFPVSRMTGCVMAFPYRGTYGRWISGVKTCRRPLGEIEGVLAYMARWGSGMLQT
jgi:hypothetical protein